MGAWHSAYFFPAAQQSLDSAAVAGSFVKNGFGVNNPARCLIPIDEEGHLGEYGAEIVLGDPLTEDLKNRLQIGDQLFVEVSKHDASSNIVTTIACRFATKAANPHLSFSWHKHLFDQLPAEAQNAHWAAIRDVAKAARAAYVILVIEASDRFEDRFVEVDGMRYLDTRCHHQFGHGIWAVWVARSLGGMRPDGVADGFTVDLGNGFVQYEVS